MVLNIAHRGARSLAPENTLQAITKAWAIGADLVEVDVTVTRDGILILLHDNLLKRTTDVSKRFPKRAKKPSTTFTLEEIRTLDAGSWFVATDPFGQVAAGNISAEELLSFTGTRIPTLEEALLFVREKSWRVNIEIKRIPPPMTTFPITDAVLDLIERLQVSPGQVIISSFVHKYIEDIRNKRPDIEINALIGPSRLGRQNWGNFRYSIYNADAGSTSEEQISKARSHGCQVNIYTVNDPSEMQRFIRAGARGIFTDFPQVLARLDR